MVTPTISQEVSVRKAQLADLDKLVELHLKCFAPKQNLPVKLGRSYLRSAYAWYISSDETFTLMVEYKGEILGSLAICERSFNLPLLKHSLTEAIKALILRPWVVFHPEMLSRIYRSFVLRRSVSENENKERGVVHWIYICVSPSARGLGISDVLLSAAKGECLSRGARILRGGFYKSNTASINMAKRSGFIEVQELRTHRMIFLDFMLASQENLD